MCRAPGRGCGVGLEPGLRTILFPCVYRLYHNHKEV